jgi:predicted membrane protein
MSNKKEDYVVIIALFFVVCIIPSINETLAMWCLFLICIIGMLFAVKEG